MYKITSKNDSSYGNLTIEKETTKISMFITIDANQSHLDAKSVFYYPNNQIKLKNIIITPDSPTEYLHFFKLNIDKYEKLKKSVKFIIAINPSMTSFNTAVGNFINLKYESIQKKVIISGLDLIRFRGINDDNLTATKIYLVDDATNLRNFFLQMKFIINEESVVKKLEYLEIIKKTFLLKELILDFDSLESRVQFIQRIEDTEYEDLLKAPGCSKRMPGGVNILLLNFKTEENYEIKDCMELNLKNYISLLSLNVWDEKQSPIGIEQNNDCLLDSKNNEKKKGNQKLNEEDIVCDRNSILNADDNSKENVKTLSKEIQINQNTLCHEESKLISQNLAKYNSYRKTKESNMNFNEKGDSQDYNFFLDFITYITYHIPRTEKYDKKESSILQNILKLAKKGNLENIIKEEKFYKLYDEEHPEFSNNCYLYYNCSINFGVINNRESSFFTGLYNFNKNSSGTIIYDSNFSPIGISFLGSYDLDLLKNNKISENILIPFSHPGVLHILARYLNISGHDPEIFLKLIKTPLNHEMNYHSERSNKTPTKVKKYQKYKKLSKKKEKVKTLKKKRGRPRIN
jgi:hypothetical protein